MRKPATRRPKEPTIALINIVCLMLIFFMVAGTLSPSIDRDVTLVETQTLDGREPSDMLVVDKTGQLRHRGEVLASAASFLGRSPRASGDVVRILPDRNLPAVDLLKISAELRAAGADRIMIATERTIK